MVRCCSPASNWAKDKSQGQSPHARAWRAGVLGSSALSRPTTLAERTGLSAYHFCRTFKQSFGLPASLPHEQAHRACKDRLAKHSMSVTDVGMDGP